MTEAFNNEADAARYAVLRKLAAGMRHALMGELQAIQFAAELAAQLVKTGGDGARVRDAVGQIPAHNDAAVKASQSMLEWLRPEERARTEVEPALRHCLKLVGDTWILRGIKATMNCPAAGATVARSAFLEVVVVSLLALTDFRTDSMDIEVLGEQVDGKVVITLNARAVDRRSAPAPAVYRILTFDDVAALADVHGIECKCSDAEVVLAFPSPAG